MSEPVDPPRIEVTIAAPVEEVWRALRNPDLIRRWHGWQFDGLEEEVRVIFVQDVTEDAEEHVLDVQGGDRFTLHPAAGGTVVCLTRAPRGSHPEWDAYYDDITEGWRTFLEQLRFGVERHGLAERRTVLLEGRLLEGRLHEGSLRETTRLADALGLAAATTQNTIGSPYEAAVATGDHFTGVLWSVSEHQCAVTVNELGEGLLIMAQQPENLARPGGGVLAVLTTYGLSDEDFLALENRWRAWWRANSVAPAPTPAG